MDSFLILHKMTEQVFENSKILQNFGIKIESRHWKTSDILVRDEMVYLRTFKSSPTQDESKTLRPSYDKVNSIFNRVEWEG